MLGVGDGLREQHADVIVVEGIDDASAPALANHEPEMTQHAQLLRYRGLFHLDLPCQLVDRARPGTETTEDPYPARSRQRLHRLRDDPGGIHVEVRQNRSVTVAHGSQYNMNT